MWNQCSERREEAMGGASDAIGPVRDFAERSCNSFSDTNIRTELSQCDRRGCRGGPASRALVGRVCCCLSRVAVGEMEVRKQEREVWNGAKRITCQPGEVNESLAHRSDWLGISGIKN
jgi:hypothetical protein